jgi:hypothetical protein
MKVAQYEVLGQRFKKAIRPGGTIDHRLGWRWCLCPKTRFIEDHSTAMRSREMKYSIVPPGRDHPLSLTRHFVPGYFHCVPSGQFLTYKPALIDSHRLTLYRIHNCAAHVPTLNRFIHGIVKLRGVFPGLSATLLNKHGLQVVNTAREISVPTLVIGAHIPDDLKRPSGVIKKGTDAGKFERIPALQFHMLCQRRGAKGTRIRVVEDCQPRTGFAALAKANSAAG